MSLYRREQLVDDCRRRMTELIHSDYSTGARLVPDVDTLAALLEVSRSVAREALRELLEAGLIARHRNGFIAQHTSQPDADESKVAVGTVGTAETVETSADTEDPPTEISDEQSEAIAASERLLARWSRESLRGVG